MRMITSLTLAAAGFLLAAPTRADLAEEFRREYPAAAARVEEAYSHARMRTRQISRDDTGEPTFVTENEYVRDGQLVWGSETVVQSNRPNARVGNVRVFGGSPKNYFRLRSDSSVFDFVKYSLRSTMNFDLITRSVARPIYSPYCIPELRIVDYLDLPDVQVISATMTDLDGREVIDVLTEYTFDEPGESGKMTYRFYFDPETWMLLAVISKREDRDLFSHQRLTYEPASDPPKLISLEVWAESPSEPGVRSKGGMLYEVTSLEFHEPPAAVDATPEP